MGTTIRRATHADAPGIAAVHVRAWQEAYAHLLPADFLAARDVDTYRARWEQLLSDGVEVHVAAVDGGIVGWASAGSGRDHDAPRARELEGIYTLAETHGTGVGQQLLDAAIGDDAAYLWIAEDNPRAEAFYRRNGFERDGTTKHEAIGPDGLDAVRMVRWVTTSTVTASRSARS